MRPSVALLIAASLGPVSAVPLFDLPTITNPFGSITSPFTNALNGFIRGSNGKTGSGTATTTAAAPAKTSASSNLNGQKAGNNNGGSAATSAASSASTAASGNSLFNPNMPLPQVANAPAAGATGAPRLTSRQQATSLQSACQAWISDTGVVSNFQNIGSGLVGNAASFKQQAGIGLAAEKDELLHKAVIDGLIGNDPRVSKANLTLTNGSFQSVINGLQDMSIGGPARVADIAAINKVRCPEILPSIDTYCQVAAQFALAQGVIITAVSAVRPVACL